MHRTHSVAEPPEQPQRQRLRLQGTRCCAPLGRCALTRRRPAVHHWPAPAAAARGTIPVRTILKDIVLVDVDCELSLMEELDGKGDIQGLQSRSVLAVHLNCRRYSFWKQGRHPQGMQSRGVTCGAHPVAGCRTALGQAAQACRAA